MSEGAAAHGMDVANEQSANERYLKILRGKVDRHVPIAVARSSRWTGTGLPIHSAPSVGPLVGRVGLESTDDLVGGRAFYIGPWHVDEDGVTAFSWAAPVAASFYEPDGRQEVVDGVLVRRTFVVDPGELSVRDFADEWLSPITDPSPFAKDAKLSVPKPPERSSAPASPLPPAVPQSPQPVPAAPARGLKHRSLRPLRAEEAVRAALSAPRGASLPTLLGTLQPDQYDFVTRPVEIPLVVQGHPGTGKTVIAAHRAAWLVHPERGEGKASIRVLLVGPNRSYARHVQGVLDSLVPDRQRVTAMGLGEVLGRLRRMKYPVSGPLHGEHYDVDNEVGYVIDAAVLELRASGELLGAKSVEDAARMVFEALRRNFAAGVSLSEDRDLVRYLKALPRWQVAVTERRLMPLISYCAASAVPHDYTRYDHVIVDEAQDVRPLEWRLITLLNRGQSWTILGDMNQRRSDWSYHTWDQLADGIGIADESGKVTVSVFARGYRSTGPIMKYANHLLPAKERQVDVVQTDGPPPRVYKVKEGEVPATVLIVAQHLVDTYPTGTIAVIATDPRPCGVHLIKDGWKQAPNEPGLMEKGSQRLRILTPDGARGLEFDGVVVVEPADFPENFGRKGPLYTSLTRANRELAIVHSKALPDELRNQGLPSKAQDLAKNRLPGT